MTKHDPIHPKLAAKRRPLSLVATMVTALGFLLSLTSQAHVGSPNVIFEGDAGPYPLRVVIKPPGVVPGLAEITVRPLADLPEKISVLPVHWQAGLEGAPPPDLAQPIAGQPGLFHAELWLMTGGAYSVHVIVEGSRGDGKVIVPVESIATQRLGMSKPMGIFLGSMGLILVFSLVSIIGAAVRESTLEPGQKPSHRRVWLSRGGKVLIFLLLTTAVWAGNKWWDSVDRYHTNRRMFQPWKMEVAQSLDSSHRRVLDISLKEPDQGWRGRSPLIPDHGKMMHLFMIRESELNAFAHLHPVPVGSSAKSFRAVLPDLPAGRYHLFADITHESGLSQTLTNRVELSAPSGTTDLQDNSALPQLQPDPEDSWSVDRALSTEETLSFHGLTSEGERSETFGQGNRVVLQATGPWKADQDATLRLVVQDSNGQPLPLQPFLGMYSHAALMRVDGGVFNHLHPVGTISMAAQQVLQLRAQGKAPKIITAETLEPFCKDPPASQSMLPLSFPVWFPQPGSYRLWVQVKPDEEVLTAVFDLEVAE